MRKWILLAVTLCFLAGAAGAENAWAWPLPADTLRAQPLRLEISAQAEELPPLGEERLRDLNAMLAHLRLVLSLARTEDGGLHCGVEAAVDGEAAAALSVTERADGSSVFALPGFGQAVRFAPGEAAARDLAPADTAGWDLMLFPDFWLPDADVLLENLLRAEGIEEKAERQTVRDNFGKTTRRLTLRAQDPAAFAALIAGACPEGFAGDFLGGLTFAGEQEISMLCRDDGFAVKVSYHGAVTAADGTERQIELEWKRSREDGSVRDMLTCRTPGKSPALKFTFDRRAKKQGGTVKIEIKDCTLTVVRPDGQLVSLSAEPFTATAEEGRLTASVTLKEAGVKGKKTVTRQTLTLTVADWDTASGTLTADWRWKDAGQDMAWSGQLSLRTGAEPAVPAAWTDPQALGLSAEEITAAGGQAFGARVLAALVLLPDEDTAFLREGLDDAAWQAVREQAGMVLDRKGGEE